MTGSLTQSYFIFDSQKYKVGRKIYYGMEGKEIKDDDEFEMEEENEGHNNNHDKENDEEDDSASEPESSEGQNQQSAVMSTQRKKNAK